MNLFDGICDLFSHICVVGIVVHWGCGLLHYVYNIKDGTCHGLLVNVFNHINSIYNDYLSVWYLYGIYNVYMVVLHYYNVAYVVVNCANLESFIVVKRRRRRHHSRVELQLNSFPGGCTMVIHICNKYIMLDTETSVMYIYMFCVWV